MNSMDFRCIKNFCNLGIGGRTLIPILLPEIRKVVPSYSSTFLWLDKTYNFVNVFDESPDSLSVTNSFINNYLGNRDREARRCLSKWLREATSPVTITSTEQLSHRKFYHSDYYHDILKPLGYHHSLYSGLRSALIPLAFSFFTVNPVNACIPKETRIIFGK